MAPCISNAEPSTIWACPPQDRRWTAAEVRQLIADNLLHTPRYELVDGELLVTPSPAYRHQAAARALLRALDPHVRRHGHGETFDARRVERWRPGDGRPEVVTDKLEWRPASKLEPLVIDLRAVFLEAVGD